MVAVFLLVSAVTTCFLCGAPGARFQVQIEGRQALPTSRATHRGQNACALCRSHAGAGLSGQTTLTSALLHAFDPSGHRLPVPASRCPLEVRAGLLARQWAHHVGAGAFVPMRSEHRAAWVQLALDVADLFDAGDRVNALRMTERLPVTVRQRIVALFISDSSEVRAA
jgi:hypothetical protein